MRRMDLFLRFITFLNMYACVGMFVQMLAEARRYH